MAFSSATGSRDAQAMHVEDVIAVVGDHLLAPHRPAAQACELAAHVAARHRDDFDGQGERAQGIDQLALVGDADEAARGGGDDLLARERGAPTLDELRVDGWFHRRRRCRCRSRRPRSGRVPRMPAALQALRWIHWSSTPRPRCFTRRAASSSMRKFTVEPVPTPSTLPSTTNSSAARAAACFPVFLRYFTAVTPNIRSLKRHCPLGSGQCLRI